MNSKDESDTSESAGEFLSGSRKNLRSEEFKRIQIRKKNAQQLTKFSIPTCCMDFNERVSDEIDTIDIGDGPAPTRVTTKKFIQEKCLLPTDVVSEDLVSGMEESGVTKTVNAGLLT